jgi:hypothetical protein
VHGYSNRLKGQAAREELEEELGYVPHKLKRNDGKYVDNHDNHVNTCTCGKRCISVKPLCPEDFEIAMKRGDAEGRKECLEFSPSVVGPLLAKFPRTEDAMKQSINFVLDFIEDDDEDGSDHEREEEDESVVSIQLILTQRRLIQIREDVPRIIRAEM